MRRAAADVTQRTDAEIFGDARRALDRHPGVPTAVHVHVGEAIATLTGTVRLPSERANAVEALRGIDGLKRVVNEIAVAQLPNPEGFEPPDTSS